MFQKNQIQMHDIPKKQNKKGVSKKQTNQTKGKGVPKTKK